MPSGFLIDTNVLSEFRKGHKADYAVRGWFRAHAAACQYVSVITLGEIRSGVERVRLRDPAQATILDLWLQTVHAQFKSRILEVRSAEADLWGRLCPSQPLPRADGLLAATALVHGLTMVTRNGIDFVRAGVSVINPWEYPA